MTDNAPHHETGPSKAKQWGTCTASVAAQAGIPDPSNLAAEEGTAHHQGAAVCLLEGLRADEIEGEVYNRCELQPEGFTMTKESVDHLRTYLAYVRGLGTDITVEQTLKSHTLDLFGTADAIVFDESSNTLHVVDLKYGKGVKVEAQENYQARLYGAMALEEYGFLYDIDLVRTHIVQPRLDHIDYEELTVAELEAWVDQAIKPALAEIRSGETHYRPSEEACRWCRARATCPGLAEFTRGVVEAAFDDLDSEGPEVTTDQDGIPGLQWELVAGDLGPLTLTELAAIQTVAGLVQGWLGAVHDRLFQALMDGEPVPGWKLVEGRSNRTWRDLEEALAYFSKSKMKADDYAPRALLSPAKIEKLLGPKQFKAKVLSRDLVHKPEGKPTLAPAADNRPAVNPHNPDAFDALN